MKCEEVIYSCKDIFIIFINKTDYIDITNIVTVYATFKTHID